jgi:hypothetical protein
MKEIRQMGEITTTPPTQTKKKLILAIGLVAAIVVVSSLTCALHWPDWLGSTRIRATTNYLIQMDELAKPAGYDLDDDAHDDYEEARRLAVGIPAELDEARSRYPTQWSPEVRQGMVQWIAANEQALGYLEQGAKKPYYWPVYAGNPAGIAIAGSELAGLRDLIFALDARIKVRASAGDQGQALADVVTLYRLGQHLGGPKVLMHQLVGMATRSMVFSTVCSMAANRSLSPQTLHALQRQLQELGAGDKGVIDFSLERFVWLDYIQRMFTDEGDGQGHIPRGAFDGLKHLPASDRSLLEPLPLDQMKAMLKLNRRDTTACVERFFEQIRVAAGMTPWEGIEQDQGRLGGTHTRERPCRFPGLFALKGHRPVLADQDRIRCIGDLVGYSPLCG